MLRRAVRAGVAACLPAVGSLGLAACHDPPAEICAKTLPHSVDHLIEATWGRIPSVSDTDHYRCAAQHSDSTEIIHLWCLYEFPGGYAVVQHCWW